MKRKESKIPLLLTMIVLGWFAFWAIGYVNRNRPAATAPVAEMQKPAVVNEVREPQQVVPQATPPATTVANVTPQKAPVQGSSTNMSVTDNSEETVVAGRTQNRKLQGVLDDSTVKH